MLPVVGLGAGVYVSADGPYSGVASFVLGSYLGVFGVVLTLGGLLASDQVPLLAGVGIILSSLGIVAIAASVLRFVAAYRSTAPAVSSE